MLIQIIQKSIDVSFGIIFKHSNWLFRVLMWDERRRNKDTGVLSLIEKWTITIFPLKNEFGCVDWICCTMCIPQIKLFCLSFWRRLAVLDYLMVQRFVWSAFRWIDWIWFLRQNFLSDTSHLDSNKFLSLASHRKLSTDIILFLKYHIYRTNSENSFLHMLITL